MAERQAAIDTAVAEQGSPADPFRSVQTIDAAPTPPAARDFLAMLNQQGASITEVGHRDTGTENHRTVFGVTFAYTLKGHSNQISRDDLGDYTCDPKVRDRLQLP